MASHERVSLRVSASRRSFRLRGYDYSRAGAYFVTIRSSDSEPVFGRMTGGKLRPSPIGLCARDCWTEIPKHFPFVELDVFILMPDHLHGIVQIVHSDHKRPAVTVGARHVVPLQDAATPSFGYSQPHSLPRVVGSFKAAVSRRVGRPIWQRNYHERIIRDEEELRQIRWYIRTNPRRWTTEERSLAVGGSGGASNL